MSKRLMRDGLAHAYAGLALDKFFQGIDDTGGWPVGYRYVGFQHSDQRAAGFTNSGQNDGWWTVIADADDYYLWKLSPAALQRVVDAAIGAVRLPIPQIGKFSIRNARDRIAIIANAEATQ